MACPYASGYHVNGDGKDEDVAQNGENKVKYGGFTYGDYLQLDKLLSCQDLASEKHGLKSHDEHLFIITHQAYELWFKQILVELDSIMSLFNTDKMEEDRMLQVLSRLNRIVIIFKLLVEQIMILETMTPLDFAEFRSFLAPASGFQSLQFRLLENKLGIKEKERVRYNRQNYTNVFKEETSINRLQDSIDEPSLLMLVEKWLERTPGLEQNGFNFWAKYQSCVQRWLSDLLWEAQEMENEDAKASKMAEYRSHKESFDNIFDEEAYEVLRQRGDRRLSYKALQGAMMISLYRDETRFHQPFLVLSQLMDIDSCLTKWRYNHVMLVQRMLGSRSGTGGSSGYLYLRSTVSDRYKVFLDLFNLSTWIVPRAYVPQLTKRMKRRLSVMDATAPPSHRGSITELVKDMQLQGQ